MKVLRFLLPLLTALTCACQISCLTPSQGAVSSSTPAPSGKADETCEAPPAEERCAALGADFCRFLNRCAGASLTECIPFQLEACNGVTGISAAEYAACHAAMGEAQCQDPMPNQCLGIAEPPANRIQPQSNRHPDQRDL